LADGYLEMTKHVRPYQGYHAVQSLSDFDELVNRGDHDYGPAGFSRKLLFDRAYDFLCIYAVNDGGYEFSCSINLLRRAHFFCVDSFPTPFTSYIVASSFKPLKAAPIPSSLLDLMFTANLNHTSGANSAYLASLSILPLV
jgi:hypothetical protein